MISKEHLSSMKARLTAEVIDDEEEISQWAVESVPELIDEVLLYRRTLFQLASNPCLDPEANARIAYLSLEAVMDNSISLRMSVLEKVKPNPKYSRIERLSEFYN